MPSVTSANASASDHDGVFSEWVRAASADAWQVEGRMREAAGGGAADLRDIRLMASGLPHPAWNNADVTGPEPDLAGARSFYARRGVPWGLRVPAGTPWRPGRYMLSQRLMGLVPGDLRPAPAVPGLELRLAEPGDAETVVALDAAGFDEDPEMTRPWVAPHVGATGFEVALAELGGETVATAFTLRSDGRAGPAFYLGGVTVVPEARGRGIAASISGWLLGRGFGRGARLGHLWADHDEAARIYARLGFRDAILVDVYTEV